MNVPKADSIPGLTEQEIQDRVSKVGTVIIDDKTVADNMTAFFVHGPTTTYIFRDGSKAHFVRGCVPGVEHAAFVTDKLGYIEELNAEVASGRTAFFKLDKFEVVTEETLDPLAAVKKQAAEEAIAKFKAELAGQRDMGSTSEKPQLKGMANSSGVSEAAAGGLAATLAARAAGAQVISNKQ